MANRVSKENYYLDIAQTVAERCTCLRKRYGTILVKNDVILSTGYKSTPLVPKGKNIHLVGDCSKVGNLRTVIWQAWDVAMKL